MKLNLLTACCCRLGCKLPRLQAPEHPHVGRARTEAPIFRGTGPKIYCILLPRSLNYGASRTSYGIFGADKRMSYYSCFPQCPGIGCMALRALLKVLWSILSLAAPTIHCCAALILSFSYRKTISRNLYFHPGLILFDVATESACDACKFLELLAPVAAASYNTGYYLSGSCRIIDSCTCGSGVGVTSRQRTHAGLSIANVPCSLASRIAGVRSFPTGRQRTHTGLSIANLP